LATMRSRRERSSPAPASMVTARGRTEPTSPMAARTTPSS
jgi:hypothetical protein